jgi:hypothetical protein
LWDSSGEDGPIEAMMKWLEERGHQPMDRSNMHSSESSDVDSDVGTEPSSDGGDWQRQEDRLHDLPRLYREMMDGYRFPD